MGIPTKVPPKRTSKPRRKRLKVLLVHSFKRWQQRLAVLVEVCPVECQEACPVGCLEVCRGECQEACPVGCLVDLAVLHRPLLALIWMMMAPTSRKSINIFRMK